MARSSKVHCLSNFIHCFSRELAGLIRALLQDVLNRRVVEVSAPFPNRPQGFVDRLDALGLVLHASPKALTIFFPLRLPIFGIYLQQVAYGAVLGHAGICFLNLGWGSEAGLDLGGSLVL